jgi:hypothetical protein
MEEILALLRSVDHKLDSKVDGSQLDRKLGDLSSQVDRKLGDLSSQVDRKLGDLSSQVDRKLGDLSSQVDRKLGGLSSQLDSLTSKVMAVDDHVGDLLERSFRAVGFVPLLAH